jgi:hypothetical protein
MSTNFPHLGFEAYSPLVECSGKKRFTELMKGRGAVEPAYWTHSLTNNRALYSQKLSNFRSVVSHFVLTERRNSHEALTGRGEARSAGATLPNRAAFREREAWFRGSACASRPSGNNFPPLAWKARLADESSEYRPFAAAFHANRVSVFKFFIELRWLLLSATVKYL